MKDWLGTKFQRLFDSPLPARTRLSTVPCYERRATTGLVVVARWAQCVNELAIAYYDMLCKHWKPLNNEKTSAFVRVCSTLISKLILQLSITAAHEANKRCQRSGGLVPSTAVMYRASGQRLANEWTFKLDIGARTSVATSDAPSCSAKFRSPRCDCSTRGSNSRCL
jgi:hypothetical protein